MPWRTMQPFNITLAIVHTSGSTEFLALVRHFFPFQKKKLISQHKIQFRYNTINSFKNLQIKWGSHRFCSSAKSRWLSSCTFCERCSGRKLKLFKPKLNVMLIQLDSRRNFQIYSTMTQIMYYIVEKLFFSTLLFPLLSKTGPALTSLVITPRANRFRHSSSGEAGEWNPAALATSQSMTCHLFKLQLARQMQLNITLSTSDWLW